MDLSAILRSYIDRMLREVSGMKVLTLDAATLPGGSPAGPPLHVCMEAASASVTEYETLTKHNHSFCSAAH